MQSQLERGGKRASSGENRSWNDLDTTAKRRRPSEYLQNTGAEHSEKRWRLRSVFYLCLASVVLALLLVPRRSCSPALRSHDTNGLSSPVVAHDLEEHPSLVVQLPNGKFRSNNRTDVVQWDEYSLLVKGQRIFLHSGEFHTWRLPVVALWPDILQKIKAAGLNGISIYTHWTLNNPSPDIIDFSDWRALQPLFDAAKDAGIWVVVRPGPYINAETSAGGIAHWATSRVEGNLRTNNTAFYEAWQAYMGAIIRETVPNQVTEGGPVIAVQIDNEYYQYGPPGGTAGYYEQLVDYFHDSDIVVPLTYNDAGPSKNFVNGTGSVDIYGLDAYPQRFDCAQPDVWIPVPGYWQDFHANTNPSDPFYFPEFQAGAFDAWGPTAPGYSQCRTLTGVDFMQVFNQALWAANAKMINYYMIYGGTSWGALPYPGVYTSYDYGAAISENRVLSDKYDELKRQGIFLRSSPDFYKTKWIGNSTTSLVSVSNSYVLAVLLRNPDTGAAFYIVRHEDSTSKTPEMFTLDVITSRGNLTIPRTIAAIALNGRQSKTIVTDYTFGKNSSVLYSTASIFFAGTIGSRDVLFVYGDSNQEHEMTLALTGTPNAGNLHSSVIHSATSSSITDIDSDLAGFTTVTFLPGIVGTVTVWDSDEQVVLYADSVTVATWWSPVLPDSKPDSDETTFANYWQIGSNDSVLIGGPYLVRNASIEGSTLRLVGDLNASVYMNVIAPSRVREVTWNGEYIADFSASPSSSSGALQPLSAVGAFVGELKFGGEIARSHLGSEFAGPISVPVLENWKYADSLPEIRRDFSDAHWTVGDKKGTNIPYKPYFPDGLSLYGCDYEFCEGHILYRGHFVASGKETHVDLSTNGGEAYASSAWINGVFLGTMYGNSTNNANNVAEVNQTFAFPEDSLLSGEENVITILLDNMGNEEGEQLEMKSPRGIRGAALDAGTNFSEWRLQGKVGGYSNYPDKTRGVLNEGGLYGVRRGWHLPGFLTSQHGSSPPPSAAAASPTSIMLGEGWVERDLAEGLPGDAAGVGFFVTTFDLAIPGGYDVAISFNFDDLFDVDDESGATAIPGMKPYRAELYVNGWHMGKRVANLGPQVKFPVHEGILEYRGENTVAVALWAIEPVPIHPYLTLAIDSVVEGGVGPIPTNNPRYSSAGRV